MPLRLTEPGPLARQLSGIYPDGSYLLSVVTLRSYRILADGRCVPDEETDALVEEPEEDEDKEGLLLRDTDLHALKPATDVVVQGHAYGRGRAQFEASVSMGGYDFRFVVSGPRRIASGADRRPRITPPEPVEEVPLLFTHAYGGRDEGAHERYGGIPFLGAFDADPSDDPRTEDMSLFDYPRNPVGRGYLVEWDPATCEGLELPNLEDPWDVLTEERLVAGQPGHWPHMALPRAPGWVGYDWFPRISHFGIVPLFTPFEGPVREVERGLAPADVMEMPEELTTERVLRGLCGACTGLQLPYLQGGEEVELRGLHPEVERTRFRLPDERPAIWTDGRKGRFNPTEPVVQTVLIEPDEGRVTLVWRGDAPALRPYLPDELDEMPLHVEWPG